MSDRVEILLVEDNETDAELCIHALKRHHFANNLVWLKDGADALDFLFGEGEYVGRPIFGTTMICSTSGCPRLMGSRSCVG